MAVFVTLPFLGWWSYGLFDLDEGFYGAIVAEMLRRHEWVTPFYNGAPWYEKPILIYWAAKPSVALFGREFGPRLPSVLAMLATFGLVAWFARRHLAPGTRYVAPLVLASSLLVVGLGRMLLTDPLLLLFLSAALLGFWESLVGGARWRLAVGAALGIAVLAKGPVSLILFVAIAALTWWREPGLRPRFHGWWGSSALVCASVVALWYVPIYLVRGDEFVQGFIIEQNVNRFLGGDVAHAVTGVANLLAYIPVVLLGMLPWSFFLWRAWPRRGDPAGAPTAARRFLASWGAVVFVFFTVAGSKLPHYMLPAMIPFGLLVADDCARRWAPVTLRRLLRPLAWTVVVAIIAQGAFLAFYHGLTVRGRVLVPGLQAEVHQLARYVESAAQPADGVVEYRTGRLRGVPSPHLINETTHPSLRFYLDRVVPVVDDFTLALADPRTLWVITRRNRIGTGELAAAQRAGRVLEPIATPFAQEYYMLYRLGPKRGTVSARPATGRLAPRDALGAPPGPATRRPPRELARAGVRIPGSRVSRSSPHPSPVATFDGCPAGSIGLQ
ncbi:MAG: glycosyltransferase family 39 protein [Gemmatimonadetes bacterium]|nr:glycosyltransferase family 39 protein [Gemmatimonadota bacterium]